MQWEEGRELIPGPATHGVWDSPDRETALAVATEVMGADGTKMASIAADGPPLPPADLEMFSDPEYIGEMLGGLQHMFAFGPQGYADDRIADGVGWISFDVSKVQCPLRSCRTRNS
jgi:hypothetical protein